MDVEIRNRPSFANLLVHLEPGDRIVAEADAMASMTSSVEMTARMQGGLLRALLRRFLGGESMFVNHFTATAPGHVVLTQPFPGDITCLELRGTTILLEPGAFLAAEPGVTLGLRLAGLKSWLAGEGLFRLRLTGTGRVWFGAYGAIFSRDVDDEFIVDTGHLVAYEPSISIRVGLAAGIFSSFFSGEGIVTRVRGPGRIYLQSRSFDGLAAWTNAHL